MAEDCGVGGMSDNTKGRKLPVGIQSFEDIRSEGYIYVDKTAYIYELMHTGKPYFLSRPRRFGKSLLLSTMKAYFEGRKDLFEGLVISELSKDDPEAFEERPVFYIDFNPGGYSADEEKAEKSRRLTIDSVLDSTLAGWEEIYGSNPKNDTYELRFKYLIEKAYEKTGRKVAVLVDEYDKPLLESDPALDGYNRSVFRGFFSVLKSCDACIKFIFITGVTKFSKVSIFSDINQLIDISIDEKYASICGITEDEMKDTFIPEIVALSERRGFTIEECLTRLRQMYDGYHFCENSEGIYNPYSILSCFYKRKFGMYWFESGTPNFLIDKLKVTKYDPKEFTSGELTVEEGDLLDYRMDNPNPVPLFYQTGYLTICDYDEEVNSYTLSYPNEEVEYGFLKCLSPMLLHREKEPKPLDMKLFLRDIRSADTDSLRDRFIALYASLPYPEGSETDKLLERDFQNVAYITFMLLGQYVKSEVHNSTGRADAIVETDDYVYLFEFKRDKSAEEAMSQIKENGYDLPYSADKRRIIKIGVNFNSEKGTIDGWLVE